MLRCIFCVRLRASASSVHLMHRRNAICEKHSSNVRNLSMKVQVMPSDLTIEKTATEWLDSQKGSRTRFDRHPWAVMDKSIQLPDRLANAARILLDNYPIKDIYNQATQLKSYIWSRQVPAEDAAIRHLARTIEHSLTCKQLQNIEVDPHSLEGEEHLEKKMELIRQQTLRQMRQNVYHWKPLVFDAYLSLVYMAGHLSSNFSTLWQILSEIKRLDPEFSPVSLLDFGSGLATSVWAANGLWDSLQHHHCWDRAVDICTLARLLLQDGEEGKEMCFRGVFFRQQLEKQQVGFDLVVSANSLFELPDQASRLRMVDSLWKQTERYMVIVEAGTLNGHHLVEEARLHVLTNYADHRAHHGHVFSPCPHDMACPRLEDGTRKPCNFEVAYKPLLVNAPQKSNSSAKPSKKSIKSGETSRYSYVVLKKGTSSEAVPRVPRVVREVKKKSKCAHCQLCFPDGQLRHSVFTYGKQSREVFRLAKHSKWGARLPIENWQGLQQTANTTAAEEVQEVAEWSDQEETTDEMSPFGDKLLPQD